MRWAQKASFLTMSVSADTSCDQGEPLSMLQKKDRSSLQVMESIASILERGVQKMDKPNEVKDFVEKVKRVANAEVSGRHALLQRASQSEQVDALLSEWSNLPAGQRAKLLNIGSESFKQLAKSQRNALLQQVQHVDFESSVGKKQKDEDAESSTNDKGGTEGSVDGKKSTPEAARPYDAPSGYSQVAARCKPDGLNPWGEQLAQTWHQCQWSCDLNPDCAAFEFEFDTGKCVTVKGVDKELALQHEEGACNEKSCCYGRPLSPPNGYSHVAARCKPDGQTIGSEVSGRTLMQCRALCDSTPGCAAFEFEFATGECEMVKGVDKELALQDEDGPCNGESCCYGRPLPAPTGYSHVAARCKPDGQTIGSEVSGKTLEECKAICDGEPGCAAFEFEFATGECEMVRGVDKELALQDEDGPCNGESCCYGRPLPAPSGYSHVAARCKPDGMSIGQEQSGKTLSECQALCDATANCAGFEFEFATGECEMVSGVDKELALQDEDGPCNGESCCYGRPLPAPTGYSHVAARCKPDGQTIGSEVSGKTLTECQALCDGTFGCAAFEFEFATGECEMVKGVDKELALQDEDGPCNGESCCYGRGVPAPEGYSQVAARCKPDGQTIGSEVSGKTLAECKAICDGEPACAAFEFEFATGECEMVKGVDKELALQDEDGPCNGESCCYGRPLAPPSGYHHVAARCKPDGKSIGQEQSGKTLTECTARCESTQGCAAFEFEFATGECEMVSEVDAAMSLEDEDGPCNGESCCYGVGQAPETTEAPSPPAPTPDDGPTTTWTTTPRGAVPEPPYKKPWDCSDGIVGKTCDWVFVDKWFRADMEELPNEELLADTLRANKDADPFGPCKDFRGNFYRADGGFVSSNERPDGTLSINGYVHEDDACRVIQFNPIKFRWQMKYVCDGLDEENYALIDGRLHSSGDKVPEFPSSSWFSEEETCVSAVQGMNSGQSCVKSGPNLQCGRMEQAFCHENQDMQQPMMPQGSWCPGGQCKLIVGSMTCLPQQIYDCYGKSAGDNCGTGKTCITVPKYNSTMPRYGERGPAVVCA